jgi:hypothetical protein
MIRPAACRASAVRLLRGVERYATDGATAEDMTAGCVLLDITDAGEVVGAVALDVVGSVATITATIRRGEIQPGELAEVERIAREHGARELRFLTRRPGLVRTMQAEGFTLACAELTKAL